MLVSFSKRAVSLTSRKTNSVRYFFVKFSKWIKMASLLLEPLRGAMMVQYMIALLRGFEFFHLSWRKCVLQNQDGRQDTAYRWEYAYFMPADPRAHAQASAPLRTLLSLQGGWPTQWYRQDPKVVAPDWDFFQLVKIFDTRYGIGPYPCGG